MAIEAVRAYFKQFGLQDKILEFETSSATVEPVSYTHLPPAGIKKPGCCGAAAGTYESVECGRRRSFPVE